MLRVVGSLFRVCMHRYLGFCLMKTFGLVVLRLWQHQISHARPELIGFPVSTTARITTFALRWRVTHRMMSSGTTPPSPKNEDETVDPPSNDDTNHLSNESDTNASLPRIDGIETVARCILPRVAQYL